MKIIFLLFPFSSLKSEKQTDKNNLSRFAVKDNDDAGKVRGEANLFRKILRRKYSRKVETVDFFLIRILFHQFSLLISDFICSSLGKL